MAVLDIVLLVLFVPAIIRGIVKGFVEQAMALVTLLVGAYSAFTFSERLSSWLSEKIIVNDSVLYIISFVIIVVVCALLFNLLAKLLTNIIDNLSLGWINRILGIILAIFNTALIIGLLFSFFNDFNANTLHMETPWLAESMIYPWIKALCDGVFPFFKDVFAQI